MGRELPLGRIAGIRIGMDWSVPIIAVLYTWILATNRFPYEQPGLSDTAYWLAGIAGALLFFASLLAHEIGHALVARHEGIGVHRIALWLLGGLTHLESNAETPRSEIRIAAIGPITSRRSACSASASTQRFARTGTAGLVGRMFSSGYGFRSACCWPLQHDPGLPLDGATSSPASSGPATAAHRGHHHRARSAWSAGRGRDDFTASYPRRAEATGSG